MSDPGRGVKGEAVRRSPPRALVGGRVRVGIMVAACAALAAGSAAAFTAASASQVPGGTAVNPYSPAAGHTYRHGVVATRGTAARMRSWAAAHPVAPALSVNDLNYGGGVDGIGVTTGPEEGELVVYGSHWGGRRTDANRDNTPSGAPA